MGYACKLGANNYSKLRLYDTSLLTFSDLVSSTSGNCGITISNMPQKYTFFVFTEQAWTTVLSFIYEKSTGIIYPAATRNYIEPSSSYPARVIILSDTSLRVTCSQGGISSGDIRIIRIFL